MRGCSRVKTWVRAFSSDGSGEGLVNAHGGARALKAHACACGSRCVDLPETEAVFASGRA